MPPVHSQVCGHPLKVLGAQAEAAPGLCPCQQLAAGAVAGHRLLDHIQRAGWLLQLPLCLLFPRPSCPDLLLLPCLALPLPDRLPSQWALLLLLLLVLLPLLA